MALPKSSIQHRLGQRQRDRTFSLDFDPRERDLPPIPKDLGSSDVEVAQCGGAKSALIPSDSSSVLLAKPSTHHLVLPIVACRPPRSSSLRPKLQLDTGWSAPPRPPYLHRAHSADDVINWNVSTISLSSLPSSSLKNSIFPPSSSQEKLPSRYPSDQDSTRHLSRSFTDTQTVRPQPRPPPSSCRFLGAMIPKIPSSKLSNMVQTRRRVDSLTSTIDSIKSKPFVHSDPHNPLHGITVTVTRQRLVSDAKPLPELFSRMHSSSSCSPCSSPSGSTASLLSVSALSLRALSPSGVLPNLDKPLPTPIPTPAEKDNPELPTRKSDNHADDEDVQAPCPSILASKPGDQQPYPLAAGITADIKAPGIELLDSDSDPDLDLYDSEVVEFKSRNAVVLTPATATRLHLRLPKRRKRYSSRPSRDLHAP
ncbi:hypothetical protein R3P38DRAFT_1580725 [Favolaschia claudopus]|uniref:Uncharacterized protein n=1 Tax=Favolaschia claudopus TaxID=2862362 RepID=A0AAW0AJ45_9AGAR